MTNAVEYELEGVFPSQVLNGLSGRFIDKNRQLDSKQEKVGFLFPCLSWLSVDFFLFFTYPSSSP